MHSQSAYTNTAFSSNEKQQEKQGRFCNQAMVLIVFCHGTVNQKVILVGNVLF